MHHPRRLQRSGNEEISIRGPSIATQTALGLVCPHQLPDSSQFGIYGKPILLFFSQIKHVLKSTTD